MRLCPFAFGLATLALLASAQPTAGQQAQTYADLVGRMTDLAQLAVLPEPGERCAQWSSYDRASRYDEASGKYIAWGANNDGPMVIRKEGQHEVLAEMQGPGCIWRIWSARAETGHVKIYLDGAAQPAVDLPFAAYFDGEHAPFNYPALSYDLRKVQSAGQNLYFPIPYQKSCKIVADKGWGRYFHFTYSTFPSATRVPSFSGALAAEHAGALAKVARSLGERLGEDPAGPRPGQQEVRKTLRVAPGGTVRAADLAGPRAISALRVKARFSDREDEMAALRELALCITWDGQSQPAVWSPLGDFFGTAPGVNLYKSLVTGMTPEGFYSYWYMPFERSAAVEIVNQGPRERQLEVEIVHAPLGRPFAGLGHFHCKWHRDDFTYPPDRAPDWQMLRTEGRGRFLGVMLHVWNPLGGWWGEGDEKFFVDGEKFPSTIGTGSEDYFGYAWCNPHFFERPYHAQSMTQNNAGHQSVLRWHVTDNIPFQKAFEGCIEKYFDAKQRGTLYACTVAWYLAPGGNDPYQPLPLDQRHDYYVVPERTAGGFKVLKITGGQLETQKMTQYSSARWDNDDQLWWTGAKPGRQLDLAIAIPQAGRYEVRLTLTKAKDYGIVECSVDGKKAAGPIDLYNPTVTQAEPVSLGVHAFTAGQHVLGVKIVGANAKALPRYMFGIDRVLLEPRP